MFMTSMTATNERVIQRFKKGLVLWSGKHFFKTYDYGCGNYSGVSLPFFQVLEVGDSPLALIENNDQMRVIKAEDDTRSLSNIYWEHPEAKAIGYKSASFILIPELERPKLPEINDWKSLLKFLRVGWFSPKFDASRKRFNVRLRYKKEFLPLMEAKKFLLSKKMSLMTGFIIGLGEENFLIIVLSVAEGV